MIINTRQIGTAAAMTSQSKHTSLTCCLLLLLVYDGFAQGLTPVEVPVNTQLHTNKM